MYAENDPKALKVLGRALSSQSRIVRLRAVAMLAHVDCPRRDEWLEAASLDSDTRVSDMARTVQEWVRVVAEPSWPTREDPAFDPGVSAGHRAGAAAGDAAPRGWEYEVEVWRGDGRLEGVFFAASDLEDDTRAKHIAMGQAILASVGCGSDRFDPESAVAFIVGKRRVRVSASAE